VLRQLYGKLRLTFHHHGYALDPERDVPVPTTVQQNRLLHDTSYYNNSLMYTSTRADVEALVGCVTPRPKMAGAADLSRLRFPAHLYSSPQPLKREPRHGLSHRSSVLTDGVNARSLLVTGQSEVLAGFDPGGAACELW
jgi:hypothetical protein